jgi:hypothetical protein
MITRRQWLLASGALGLGRAILVCADEVIG